MATYPLEESFNAGLKAQSAWKDIQQQGETSARLNTFNTAIQNSKNIYETSLSPNVKNTLSREGKETDVVYITDEGAIKWECIKAHCILICF